MASVDFRKDGRPRIQFKHPIDGFRPKRPSITLWHGVSQADAQIIAGYVDRLCRAAAAGRPPDVETAQWLRTTPPELQGRLGELGLTKSVPAVTVGELCESFFADWAGSDSTRRLIRYVTQRMCRYFGGERQLLSITKGDASDFHAWLVNHGGKDETPLAESTAGRRTRRAREIFAYAVDKEWVERNPFRGVRTGKEHNHDRDFFVTREIIAEVLEQEPDPQFRALLALYRFGGLRAHEAPRLTWGQVRWDNDFIRVYSSKTQWREVPLWPEIATHLNALWDVAEDRENDVFPKYRNTSRTYLANKLESTCRKCGRAMWPKPFQNMRSSRETELYYAGKTPQDVANWLGHSVEVAARHYLQVVKELAASNEARSGQSAPGGSGKSQTGAKLVHPYSSADE